MADNMSTKILTAMYKFLPVIVILGLILSIYFYLPFKRWTAYQLHLANDPTTACCEVNEIIKQDGRFDENANIAIFNNEIIDYPKTSLAESFLVYTPSSNVLGTKNAAGEEKWVEVSLQEQKLRAWEGNRVVIEFPISSGLWYPTPKGNFGIWYKTRAQTMKGGSKELGTYYNLPNVPNNMFFYQGFAIHGAYWHNNFGHPMSHGCVNSPLTSATQLFEWSGPVLAPNQWVLRATPENPGTRVLVH